MSLSSTLKPPHLDLINNNRHNSINNHHQQKQINPPNPLNHIIPFNTNLPPTPPGSANSSPPPQFSLIDNNSQSHYFQQSAHSHYNHPHHYQPISNLYNNLNQPTGLEPSTLARRQHHEFPSTPNLYPGHGTTHHRIPPQQQSLNLNSHNHLHPNFSNHNQTHNHLHQYQQLPLHRDHDGYPAGWDGTLSALLSSWFNHLHQSFNKISSDRSFLYLGNRSPQLTPTIQQPLKQALLDRFNSISVSSIKFYLLCALWYSSSAFSSNTGKVILNRFKYPVTLTIVQFGLVAIWSGLFICLRDGQLKLNHTIISSRSSFSFLSTLGIRRPTKSMLRGTFIMSLFSIAGHVFSSMAMARIPVSTVHTIKALSPLFTVIAYAGLFGVRYGFLTYFSLLPLTLGVMLACSFDMRANGIGFLCALGSTIVFVSQNIFGKKLLPSSSSSSQKHKRTLSSSSAGNQIDKLNLLFYSSAMAFLLMIPIWIWVDSRALLFSSESIDLVPSSSEHNPTGLSVYFIINGTVHFAQCILAFTILSQTSPVTYSIASLIKRVVVIAMSIVWFNQKVSSLQFFGMILTFLGLYIYNRTKSEIDRGERKRERQVLGDSLILPTNEIEAKQLAAEK